MTFHCKNGCKSTILVVYKGKLLFYQMKCVYMFISPSNKVYVGKSVDLKKRFEDHKHRGSNKQYKTYFYNALRKYGWDNFTRIVLEIFPHDVSNVHMSIRERYWISHYKAFGEGYNLTEGGEGTPGYRHTEKSKKGMQDKVRAQGKMKKVHAKNVNTGEEYEFESRAEAMRELRSITSKNISRFHITDCCKGVQKTHAGFIFKYV
jgi:group I intron endonuclease